MIPKIIHRIWIGDIEIPSEFQDFWHSWKIFHPDWKFFDWNNESIKDLSLYPIIAQIKVPAAAADIARYEILCRYGGVYVDCDFECKKNIEELIQNTDFLVCNENGNFGILCSNSFFASEPEHKILKKAINELLETDIDIINNSSPDGVTGPYFFRRVINNHQVKLLPTETLYPYMHFKRDYYKYNPDKVYAIHHWHNSWSPLPSLKWLAERQLTIGDYLSCLETCQKVRSRFVFDKEISIIESKASQIIKKRQALLNLFRKPLFEFMLRLSQGITVSRLSIKDENQSNIRKDKSSSLVEKVTKKISNKVVSNTFIPIYEDHLLDYSFSRLFIKNLFMIGTPDKELVDKLSIYSNKYGNISIVSIDPIDKSFEESEDNNKGNLTFEVCKYSIQEINPLAKNLSNEERLASGLTEASEKANFLEISSLFFKSDIFKIYLKGNENNLIKDLLNSYLPKIISFKLPPNGFEGVKDLSQILIKKGYLIFFSPDGQVITACQDNFFYNFCLYLSANYSVFPSL